MHANIVLTGFMGTGKSTVGRMLATRLARQFVDTDWLIEQRHGSIAEIFATGGESAFRALEVDVAAELAAQQELVIATGGRMLVEPINRAALESTGRVFCLTADPGLILARLTADGIGAHRPLLGTADPAATILRLLAERAPAYAHFQAVATDGLAPDEVADQILALLGCVEERPDARGHLLSAGEQEQVPAAPDQLKG